MPSTTIRHRNGHIPKKRFLIRLDNQSTFPIISNELRLCLGPTLCPAELEKFIRQQAGLPDATLDNADYLILRLEDSQGFTIPFVWDDLENNGTYIGKIISSKTRPSRIRLMRQCRSLSLTNSTNRYKNNLPKRQKSKNRLDNQSTIPFENKKKELLTIRTSTTKRQRHLNNSPIIPETPTSVSLLSQEGKTSFSEDSDCSLASQSSLITTQCPDISESVEQSISSCFISNTHKKTNRCVLFRNKRQSQSHDSSSLSSEETLSTSDDVFSSDSCVKKKTYSNKQISSCNSICHSSEDHLTPTTVKNDTISNSTDISKDTFLTDTENNVQCYSSALVNNESTSHHLMVSVKKRKHSQLNVTVGNVHSNERKSQKEDSTSMSDIHWIYPSDYIIKEHVQSNMFHSGSSQQTVEEIQSKGPTMSVIDNPEEEEEEQQQQELKDPGVDSTISVTDDSTTELMTIYKRVPWLNLGQCHPEPLAESESLAFVSLPPLNPSLEIRLPLEVMSRGHLSNPQLECCIYACRAFNQIIGDGKKGGYFLGEGTGCGKGRIISSSIWHLWNVGYRRHVWITVGTDLLYDAMRDLRDIGAGHIPILDLGNISVCDLDSPNGLFESNQRVSRLNKLWKWKGEGVLFATYSLLSRSVNHKIRENCLNSHEKEKWDIQNPTDTNNNHYYTHMTVTTRLGQVIKWMSRRPNIKQYSFQSFKTRLTHYIHKNPNDTWKLPYWLFRPDTIYPGGLLCFDEAHKAKNLVISNGDEFKRHTKTSITLHKGTATGQTVQKCQDILIHCPVLYASATGATELRHMAYMTRLGLWGKGAAFSHFSMFKDAVERGGVAAMECLAMDLKSSGLYSCRTLSFYNVTFNSIIVPSSVDFIQCYNQITNLMSDIYQLIQSIYHQSSGSSIDVRTTRTAHTYLRSHFWGTQQRIFKQLLVSQKVNHAVTLAKEALDRQCQIVISLWGTGEARTAEKIKQLRPSMSKFKHSNLSLEEHTDCIELDDFLSPPKLMLEQLIKDKLGHIDEFMVSQDQINHLLHQLHVIQFPNNPLDDLIDKLGGPNNVAELSGRTKRLVWDNHTNKLQYIIRDVGEAHEKDITLSTDKGFHSVNLREQQLFQYGRKKIAVITEAASAGISLHSDSSLLHTAPREMICIELPWAADKAVQQFGRVHRSNQKYPPTYHLLVSDIGGERRFVACIAKRMKTLGAITRGDRRAAFIGHTTKHLIESSATMINDELIQHDVVPLSTGFLDLDIYSKFGMQARSLFFKWLTYYVTGPLPGIERPKLSPPPSVLGTGINSGRYSSNGAFATHMNELFCKRGIIDLSLGTNRHIYEKSKTKDMDKFLNRLLMLPVEQQNEVFAFYNQIHDELVEAAKLNGEYDKGVENLNQNFGTIYSITISSREVLWTNPISGSETVYFKLAMDRGITWDQSQTILYGMNRRPQLFEGYYWIPNYIRKETQCVALVVRRRQLTSGPRRILIYKPHLGVSAIIRHQLATVASLDTFSWKKATIDEYDQIKQIWEHQYTNSYSCCIHEQLYGSCKMKGYCQIGKRIQEEHLLTGNIITLWSRLERLFKTNDLNGDDDDIGVHNGTSNILDPHHDIRSPSFSLQNKLNEGEHICSRPSRILRLVRVMISDSPTLVGAKIPADKLMFIKRNLQTFTSIDCYGDIGIDHDIDASNARAQMYTEMMYFKFLKFIIQTIINKSSIYGTQCLPTDTVYALVMDALDSQHQDIHLPEWTINEIKLINLAFPPTAIGLDHFDVFLTQATVEFGVSREFHSQKHTALFTFSPNTCPNYAPTTRIRDTLRRHFETHRFHSKHLESRKDSSKDVDDQLQLSIKDIDTQFVNHMSFKQHINTPHIASTHFVPLVLPSVVDRTNEIDTISSSSDQIPNDPLIHYQDKLTTVPCDSLNDLTSSQLSTVHTVLTDLSDPFNQHRTLQSKTHIDPNLSIVSVFNMSHPTDTTDHILSDMITVSSPSTDIINDLSDDIETPPCLSYKTNVTTVKPTTDGLSDINQHSFPLIHCFSNNMSQSTDVNTHLNWKPNEKFNILENRTFFDLDSDNDDDDDIHVFDSVENGDTCHHLHFDSIK